MPDFELGHTFDMKKAKAFPAKEERIRDVEMRKKIDRGDLIWQVRERDGVGGPLRALRKIGGTCTMMRPNPLRPLSPTSLTRPPSRTSLRWLCDRSEG